MPAPIRVAVTGAAGQIGYALLFRLASGEIFGADQPVLLHLVDVPPAMGGLDGIHMELDACAFPTLPGVVKAASDVHAKILERIGADTVIFPEKNMGERVAYSLVSGSVIDHIELSDDVSVIEIVVNRSLSGKTLRDLNLRNRMGLTIVAIKRNNHVNVFVSPDEPLREGDILVAVGPNDGVQKLSKITEKG